MSKANEEQLKAIRHDGGVLLKAGAGSGKTFVLKEHIIYKTEKWFEEAKKENLEDFLSKKYGQTVLMTFTKKAAGEIQIRLRDEFEQRALDDEKWSYALSILDKLTVTTIHGFCLKLIKEGHFKNIDSNVTIISNAEYYKKIKELFDSWMNQEDDLDDLILKDQNKILDSMIKIFSDPVIRRAWSDIEDLEDFKINPIRELFDLIKLDLAIIETPDLNPENEGKKWYTFIENFSKEKFSLNSKKELLRLIRFFEKNNYKIPVSPRGKTVTPEEKIYYSNLKALNDFLKKEGEGLFLYLEHFDELIVPWFKKIKSIFDYIEDKYLLRAGFIFSDLEYIAYKELKKNEERKSVSERYKYLIIDEFQDTSFIQYDIIKSVLNNDLSKLFCVGDVKQAIYGFRGGELGVFLNCEKEIPKVLSLRNNYRSDQKIIKFNNYFFDNIFKKSFKFEGEETRPVEVEFQSVPLPDRAQGTIKFINSELENIDKISNQELELLEAKSILNNIKSEESSDIAILYKKLKPSLLIMGLMIKNKVPFKAQVKVPYLEDPILAIFLVILENKYDSSENNDESLKLYLTAYLSILEIEVDENNLSNNLMTFKRSIPYFGLYQSFYRFLNLCGISNSNYSNNLNYIEKVCSLYREDFASLIAVLKMKESESYSLDFNFMDNSEITIMSAHASKGLEFSTVYLAGIYTNDKSMPDMSIFGNYPLSFTFKADIHSKKRYKTPELLLERELIKRKEFSESKRLFYVASTRAENNLRFVKFEFNTTKFRSQSNSWIKGLESWINDGEQMEIINDLKAFETFRYDEKSLDFVLKRKPLFHIDNVGINLKNSCDSLIMPELSVTKLASIFNCPRKFYFKNILKLNDEKQDFFYDDVKATSSSNRGSKIHQEISDFIENNFSRENLDITYLKEVDWTSKRIKEVGSNLEFKSEKAIKFEIFGHMISGIPDLVIRDLGHESFEIWDFKTGRSKSEEDSIYHFQLICYAYALYTLGSIDMKKDTKIVLCYIDEKKLVDKTISFHDCHDYLLKFWKKVNAPDLVNLEHCDSCEFNKFCK